MSFLLLNNHLFHFIPLKLFASHILFTQKTLSFLFMKEICFPDSVKLLFYLDEKIREINTVKFLIKKS